MAIVTGMTAAKILELFAGKASVTHAATHAATGSDPLSVSSAQITDLTETVQDIVGANAPRPRPDAAGELVAARLDTAVTDITVGIAGDSTGNDSDEWIRAWLATIGPRYPDLRIKYGLWSDSTQTMPVLSVLQAGVSDAVSGVKLTDTFTRTAADINGSTPDVGPAWSAPASIFSLDGSKAVCTGSGHAISDGLTTGDVTISATGVTLDTRDSPTPRQFQLVAKYVSANTHVYLYVNVSATGNASVGIYKRIGGTATLIAGGAAVSAGIPSDTAAFTFNASLAVVGATVTAVVNGVTVTGTLTDPDIAAFQPATKYGFGSSGSGSAGAISVDGVTASVDADAAPQRLTVFNGSMPGSQLSYAQSRVALMFPEAPDVVIINSGHNYGAGSPAVYLTAVDDYISALHAVYPAARIIVSSQNPEFSPAANRVAHARRLTELRVYALANGYGYVPAHEAFLNEPDGGASLVNGDGIHPTPAGSALWAATFDNYLTSKSLRTP